MHVGLSLDQAPPFAVPLRFYLSAPLFLAATGLLAAWPGLGWSTSPEAPASIALTHLLVLGFLGMVMLGSLAQMLPVVAGAALPACRSVSRLSQACLLLGTPLLTAGMLTLTDWPLVLGAGLLGLGLGTFATAAGLALIRARPSPTVWAMRLALVCLILLWPLGAWLAAWLAGHAAPADPAAMTNIHAGLGLLGWVTLLVVGVAYQVVPMLQITPNYPPVLARWLAWALFVLLLAWVAGTWLDGFADARMTRLVTGLGLAGLVATFALATLDLQRRRRRKLRDATLDYWRLAMLSLTLAAGLGAAILIWPQALDGPWRVLLGMLFLLGFAAGVMNGMLFKIVPFLAWFHLNAQIGMRRTGLVNMKDFIADAQGRRQLRLHLAAMALLLPSPWLEWLAVPGGLALAASALYLEGMLWRAWRLFRGQGGRL